MSVFSEIWDTQVKQLAEACVTEKRLVELMSKDKSYNPNEEEKEYMKKISGKYKDIAGMYYISDMIWRVEHALADDRSEHAKLAIAQVYDVLNRPSYFHDVFKENEDDEEWKTRAALRDGLKKLLYV